MGKRARERAEDGAHDLMSSEVAHVIRGTRYQVPGTRYQVPGTRYQVLGTRY